MDNVTALGQPIPTGIITPADLISQSENASPNFKPALGEIAEYSILPSPGFFIDLMFAPINFWASATAVYLRILDFSEENPPEVPSFSSIRPL